MMTTPTRVTGKGLRFWGLGFWSLSLGFRVHIFLHYIRTLYASFSQRALMANQGNFFFVDVLLGSEVSLPAQGATFRVQV